MAQKCLDHGPIISIMVIIYLGKEKDSEAV